MAIAGSSVVMGSSQAEAVSSTPTASTIAEAPDASQTTTGNRDHKSTAPRTTESSRPLYQDLCADIEDYTGHAYVPSEWHYINPTDEELASLQEVDWSAPGDYSYMVDWMDPEFRPKLFQAASSGYFYVETTTNVRDPDHRDAYYYRRFVPEDYIPKKYLEIPLESGRGEDWHNGASSIMGRGFWENAPKLKEDVELPEAESWKTVAEKVDFYLSHSDFYRTLVSEWSWDERRVCFPFVEVKPVTIENLFQGEPGNGAKAGPLNVLEYGPAGAFLGMTGWAKTNDRSELLAGAEWVLRNTTTGKETRVVDSTEPLPPRPWKDVHWRDLTEEQERDIEAWEMLDADPRPGAVMLNHDYILDEGEYELSEVVSPNGYMLLTRPVKFTVRYDPLAVYTLGEIVNIKPGMLHWRKVDEQGNPLPGSVWKIVNTDSGEEYVVEDDSSGNIFKEDLVSEIGNDVLAQPGNIDVPLPPGKYTVQEIQAPEGYILDSTVHTAVLDASTGTAEGVYEDYLGELVNKRIPTVTVTTTVTPDPTTVTTTATPPVVTTTETTENTVTTTQTPPVVTTTETTENTVTTTQTPPVVTTTETTENTATTTQTPPVVTTTETTENTATTTQTPPVVTTTKTITEPAVTVTETKDCDCAPVTVTETPSPATETAPVPSDAHTPPNTPNQHEHERTGLLASTGANTVGILLLSGLTLALGGIFVTRRKK